MRIAGCMRRGGGPRWILLAVFAAASQPPFMTSPAHAQELDVLIDGNGEGLYGEPGSGSGGFAEVFGVSPDTVEFMLEIRNYYGKTNKYRISWNQIPGWVATVNGNGSPYTTPNINPGASFFAAFRVVVPSGVVPGAFQYILDVDAVKFKTKPHESVTALVHAAGSAVGQLSLSKQTDRAAAVPGEVISYTIEFLNAGADTVWNIVMLDTVSIFVDVLPGGFGPGMDVEWRLPGRPPAYLTLDPADDDECEFSPSERLMRIIFSKNTPLNVPPGERGWIAYKVMVK